MRMIERYCRMLERERENGHREKEQMPVRIKRTREISEQF